MLSVTHVATSSLIAHYIPIPSVYIPMSIVTHYLLDMLPHWDCGTGLDTATKSKKTAILQELVDLMASGLFVYFVFQYGNSQLQIHVWIAALVSLLPDFLEAPSNFLNYDSRILTILNKTHSQLHSKSLPMLEGLTLQIVLLFVVYLLS